MENKKRPSTNIELENQQKANLNLNKKAEGIGMGNGIKSADQSTPESKDITAAQRYQQRRGEQNKLWSEKENSEKAAKDPAIQEVKAKQEKEHPQPKKEQVVKQPTEKKAQTHKEVKLEKQRVFKKLGDKAKVLFQKIKGNNSEKNKPEKQIESQKAEQPKRSLLRAKLAKDAGAVKEGNEQRQPTKEAQKDTPVRKSVLRNKLAKVGGNNRIPAAKTTPSKTTKTPPVRTK